MPSFSQLWANHPVINGTTPLLDPKVYQNQCAINLFASLRSSGVNVTTFHGQLSWQKGKPKYAIRAQELADWLARPGAIAAPVQKFDAKTIFDKIGGKRGIVFFKNYWGQGRQGDHIDLWNGTRLTDWTSWARVHAYISLEGVWSDYRKAEAAWFWMVP
jgi:hypothetical protein